MKNIFFNSIILFILLLLFDCSPPNKNNSSKLNSIPKINDRTDLNNFLGDSLFCLLSKPDSVIVYAINGRKKDTLNGFMKFEIIKKANVNFKKTNLLLLDTLNYSFDQYHKKCSFRPSIGIKYFKNNKVVNIAVATDCGIIKFKLDTLELTDDCDSAIAKYKSFYIQIFNDTIK